MCGEEKVICLQLSPDTEREWYEHCIETLKRKACPPFYSEQCKAFIKAYDMKNGTELPSFIDVIHGDKD